MDSIFWLLSILFVLHYFLINSNEINSDSILSSVVLKSTGQETLSKEEQLDVEYRWDTLINPGVEVLQSMLQIFDISSESLKGWIRDFLPHGWHLTELKGIQGSLKVIRK
jgi:hypothetical protein